MIAWMKNNEIIIKLTNDESVTNKTNETDEKSTKFEKLMISWIKWENRNSS